ncbi:hypothetical protein SCLCIDRAFT_1213897, partial [Scleroderma citrinum Foug A]
MLFLLIVAALPALVAALFVNVLHESISVPLRKRSSLTTDNGDFDMDGARAHLAFTEAKISAGFRALEVNAGETSISRRDPGSIPLTNDQGTNARWYGTISVGTPPVDFKVDFDTGSADLFLPASTCGQTCSGHTLYNPNASSTAIDRNATFILSYGDGTSVQGEQYADTVIIGGYIATGQVFGAANQFSSSLQTPAFTPDGVLGMAFEILSIYHANPVIQTLISNNALPDPVFAFSLASSGAELRIGGVNSALYTGSLTYTPVTQKGFWQISGDTINVNGNPTITSFSAVVDSGTTLILGNLGTVGQFYSGLNVTDLGNGFYTLPCDSMPIVSITIGGTVFPLSPDTFNLGTYPSGSNQCACAISSTGSLGKTMLLGDTFLRNVYSVFDVEQTKVGFATL